MTTTPLRREDLKRNELGEALEAGVHYAEDHLKTILWIAGGVLGAALLVWAVMAWRGTRDERGNRALGEALRVAEAPVVDSGAKPTDAEAPSFASEAARAARAKELFEAVVARHGGTAAGAAARLWLADVALVAGDAATARRQWEAYLDDAPDGALAATAQRNVWALDRAEGKGEVALAAIQRDLERGGRKLPADVLLWELATTQQALGRSAEAAAAWRRIGEEHPNSPFADEARRLAAGRAAA
ncbi:MAG: tetratricopeptide repeat protein [Thermoanaerobaculia bacterium]|nr:tetratricopeptide repeat protein [Thermoanaerobaculia bacterium]